jgi:hypothetical protein
VPADRLFFAARILAASWSRGPRGVPSPREFRLTEDDLLEGWRWKTGREWRTVIRWPGAPTSPDADALRRARGRSRLDVFVDEDDTASLTVQLVPLMSEAHAGRWLGVAAETQLAGRSASITSVAPAELDLTGLGDEHRAWRNAGLKVSHDEEIEDLCIAWRRGPVGVALIASPADAWTMDGLAEIARRQDVRIRDRLPDRGDARATGDG